MKNEDSGFFLLTSSFFLGWLCLGVTLFGQTSAADRPPAGGPQDPLIQILVEELEHSMRHLTTEDSSKPYYLSYTVTDVTSASVRGSLGAVHRSDGDRARSLDVDLRVGDYSLDNTHQIRGGGGGGRSSRTVGGAASVALDNDPAAIKNALWQSTDRAFKSAVERFQRVKTDLKTTVEEENKAHDFSR